MFLRKKGQSTAEYAIVIGLVIAVAAGVLQAALKGGIRKKTDQALGVLDNAGLGTGTGELSASVTGLGLYSQEYRETKIMGGDDYVDQSVMKRGGQEEKYQKQTTETTSVSIETLDASN